MTEEKIARINFLARKSRETGLEKEEKAEQEALRKEYVEHMKRSLRTQLENTRIVDENGNITKLKTKNEKR